MRMAVQAADTAYIEHYEFLVEMLAPENPRGCLLEFGGEPGMRRALERLVREVLRTVLGFEDSGLGPFVQLRCVLGGGWSGESGRGLVARGGTRAG